ncbi:MAG TPA: cyclopropane-fatty-acyl-phospholipid synthase family protein [Nevskiales bacterium]|nr:cyclopropane-fatty-acyl-phospholipid synthase family protein [Nevskiales bacterium]
MRLGCRWLCRSRLAMERAGDVTARQRARVRAWHAGPIAVNTRQANEQHYEVPPGFFEAVLGPHLKYSCAVWPRPEASLAQAEVHTLALTAERARLADGQRILELGCGWGSLSLWMAARFPRSRIVAVSNSQSQREWIQAQARGRGLSNLEVVTADINHFETAERFDRVVSVEMFEHVRNHAELLRRIQRWLLPDGLFFVHVFCHRQLTYPFEATGSSDWMARHFFSGGVMPSFDLLPSSADGLVLLRRWWIDGTHYARTSDAWLARLDANRSVVQSLFERKLSAAQAKLAVQRWRMFFIAVSELFGYRRGREWGVGHYLFAAPLVSAHAADGAGA